MFITPAEFGKPSCGMLPNSMMWRFFRTVDPSTGTTGGRAAPTPLACAGFAVIVLGLWLLLAGEVTPVVLASGLVVAAAATLWTLLIDG